eukprot:CAMPEP_0196762770 /NCGR_PEP_ID=MMETSP1095-20130614/2756_1 /TAXON_ID=96789 ORGANISM="Chromulina nebulosa, Strain UTEXLB2642" /NCGR_SAMPLE_ID=MMETSP1095 /ASSEMBLY_ACC=CAM_ASM_000446 /LENGTH=144 /DNA_ID=CAMNT_0042114553 /DNA_START=402 /DNA_END=836 /DNA_ORIENTATION=-
MSNTQVTVSTRPDGFVTRLPVTKGTIYSELLVVVKIQSKPNIASCRLQLLTYLFTLMNVRALPWLIGILVDNNGKCRAFKATRNDVNCVYEENGTFDISHIVAVIELIIEGINDKEVIDIGDLPLADQEDEDVFPIELLGDSEN